MDTGEGKQGLLEKFEIESPQGGILWGERFLFERQEGKARVMGLGNVVMTW